MNLRIEKENLDCTIDELVYYLQCMREQYGNIYVDYAGRSLIGANPVVCATAVYLRLY
jgi:hypothetical protein